MAIVDLDMDVFDTDSTAEVGQSCQWALAVDFGAGPYNSSLVLANLRVTPRPRRMLPPPRPPLLRQILQPPKTPQVSVSPQAKTDRPITGPTSLVAPKTPPRATPSSPRRYR